MAWKAILSPRLEAFVQNPKSEAVLENMVFAHFGPEEFPTLHDVQDEIQARGQRRPATPESEEYRDYREVIGSVAA